MAEYGVASARPLGQYVMYSMRLKPKSLRCCCMQASSREDPIPMPGSQERMLNVFQSLPCSFEGSFFCANWSILRRRRRPRC